MPLFKWTSENAQRTLPGERNIEWEEKEVRAGLNICTLSHVIYLSESCHTLWQILSFSEMAVLQGLGFLFSGSQESAGSDWSHWSAIICMLNTPVVPWCWRGTLARNVAQLQGPKCQSYSTHRHKRVCTVHTCTHTKGTSVIQSPVPCLHCGAFDELCCVRDAVSGILSGPSDLSAVVHPSSPFDLQEKGPNCSCLNALTHSKSSFEETRQTDFLWGFHWFQFAPLLKSICSLLSSPFL